MTDTEQKARQVEGVLVIHGRRGMKHGFETWCGLPWEPEMTKAPNSTDMSCRKCVKAFNNVMDLLRK